MAQSDDAKDRLTSRDWEMWSAYVRGRTQQQLATAHGISQSAVSLRLKAVRESFPRETLEQIKQRHLDGISALSHELWLLVDSPPTQAYSNGRRMETPNPDDPDGPGEPVWDHSTRLQAMDRLAKLQERESRLLGLDSPIQQEIAATVHRPKEVLELIEQARAQSEADEAALKEGQE